MTKKGPFLCSFANHRIHVPHVTIFHTILRSMLWILFIEIALLVGILYLCRINTNLEQNAVDILQIQTENRQNYLQGQMLDAQDLSSLAGRSTP